MYDKNNVFAKIIRGEIPCKRVWENDFAISFYDLNPVAQTHILIIPKGEYINMFDFVNNASAEEQAGFWACLTETARNANCIDGCNVWSNVGEGTFFYQSVPHFHIHLIAGDKKQEFADVAK
jgi:diadenosine tetraphosphate (Ap4A) HIT family hydrolase